MTTTVRHVVRRARTHAAHQRPEALISSWEDRSACYNRPEAWWDGDDPQLTEKARAVCRSCPVLAECLGEQMRREKTNVWVRDLVRGGLTGPERVQLCIDEQQDGPYDAEEARLLALEAVAYGVPVSDLAEDGTSVSTRRLAGRLAGEKVEARRPAKVQKDTAMERAFKQADQIMHWRSEGVSRREICARLSMGRTSVDRVIQTYEALIGNAPVAGAQRGAEADDGDIRDYLAGRSVRLSKDQKLAAVAKGLERGMRYPDIDRAQSLERGTTAQFVSRMRKQYLKEGREFPITTMAAKRLTFTDEQVLAIRNEYAAGGVRDMDLAMKYGVSRNVISHVISGRNYKHVGGPIRKGKSEIAKAESRKYNDEFCAVAFGRSRDRNAMGAAA